MNTSKQLDSYGLDRIALELDRTALGDAYYGNALYAAMGLNVLDADDISCLRRWLEGGLENVDHIRLQNIAIKIRKHIV